MNPVWCLKIDAQQNVKTRFMAGNSLSPEMQLDRTCTTTTSYFGHEPHPQLS